MPPDPASYCETLGRLWLFDGTASTEVDAKRTEMMQAESLRQQKRQMAVSLEDYLATLNLRVELRPPAEEEWARVAQLTQRTNQFNLSLKRRSVEDLVALGANATVFILKASDRFGDYGLVGVAIVQNGTLADAMELDTFLMSCRALGRGIEEAFLYGIADAMLRRSAATLLAPYVEGPRNGLIREFLSRAGFREKHANMWELPLEQAPSLPTHVQFKDAESVRTALSSPN